MGLDLLLVKPRSSGYLQYFTYRCAIFRRVSASPAIHVRMIADFFAPFQSSIFGRWLLGSIQICVPTEEVVMVALPKTYCSTPSSSLIRTPAFLDMFFDHVESGLDFLLGVHVSVSLFVDRE